MYDMQMFSPTQWNVFLCSDSFFYYVAFQFDVVLFILTLIYPAVGVAFPKTLVNPMLWSILFVFSSKYLMDSRFTYKSYTPI